MIDLSKPITKDMLLAIGRETVVGVFNMTEGLPLCHNAQFICKGAVCPAWRGWTAVRRVPPATGNPLIHELDHKNNLPLVIELYDKYENIFLSWIRVKLATHEEPWDTYHKRILWYGYCGLAGKPFDSKIAYYLGEFQQEKECVNSSNKKID